MGCSKSSAKREVCSNTSLCQKTRKTSNNLALYLKQQEKEEQKNPKFSRGEKNHKDQSRHIKGRER